MHTGDYKLDETPAGGRTTDLTRLRPLTPNGVLALLADSTNADRPGRTPTEKLVADELDRLFAEATQGRIIIATFASLLARLQEIMIAGPKARPQGRADRAQPGRECDAGARSGLPEIPDGLLVDVDAQIPDKKLLILATGSQGRTALGPQPHGAGRAPADRR